MTIPKEITQLIMEATDGRNDGWSKKAAQDKLREIRDYINTILDGSTLTTK